MGKSLLISSEQIKFLAANVKDRSYQELTDMFNSYFNTQFHARQITGVLRYNHLSNGRDSSFKHGHTSPRRRPVGHEREERGCIMVKCADPSKWKRKHILIWEAIHGPLPKNHVVIFGDGNRHNFEPENLLLVSRKELMLLNKKHLIQNDIELTKVGILVADIHMKTRERWEESKARATPRPKGTRERPVIRTNDGRIYPSSVAAAKDMNGKSKSVRLVCNGKHRQYKGYTFRYLDAAQINQQEINL